MIAHISIAAVKVCKILSVFVILGLASLAAGEMSSNRALIIVSAMTSGTALVGVLFTGCISVYLARKVAPLPNKIEELRKNTDGIQEELKTARQQTSEAKQEVARAAGVAQERTEERERVASAPPIVVEEKGKAGAKSGDGK